MKSKTTARMGFIYTRHRPVTLRRVGCHRLFWANATGNCNLKQRPTLRKLSSLRVWCVGGWNGPWGYRLITGVPSEFGPLSNNSGCTCACDACCNVVWECCQTRRFGI
ncbi:hypothetical protein Pyn_21592 [Prunus yedoensis var. nudiflora]|uniref:Uncharacterized protein n=1 Tax=Prunus yedoensis var. nudiflora TaxID=2094558 RepID=A0A314XX41_PRUYE|nr:hypothetical protein Pyn_21592 [Prunus yedoensis var. nudiflora]